LCVSRVVLATDHEDSLASSQVYSLTLTLGGEGLCQGEISNTWLVPAQILGICIISIYGQYLMALFISLWNSRLGARMMQVATGCCAAVQ